MRGPSSNWIFTGNETLCAARRCQQAAQPPHRARFLGGFLVAQIVATFHGRAGAAISIRGLCCSFHLGWDLEPMPYVLGKHGSEREIFGRRIRSYRPETEQNWCIRGVEDKQ